jgi:hypothetical protein
MTMMATTTSLMTTMMITIELPSVSPGASPGHCCRVYTSIAVAPRPPPPALFVFISTNYLVNPCCSAFKLPHSKSMGCHVIFLSCDVGVKVTVKSMAKFSTTPRRVPFFTFKQTVNPFQKHDPHSNSQPKGTHRESSRLQIYLGRRDHGAAAGQETARQTAKRNAGQHAAPPGAGGDCHHNWRSTREPCCACSANLEPKAAEGRLFGMEDPGALSEWSVHPAFAQYQHRAP